MNDALYGAAKAELAEKAQYINKEVRGPTYTETADVPHVPVPVPLNYDPISEAANLFQSRIKQLEDTAHKLRVLRDNIHDQLNWHESVLAAYYNGLNTLQGTVPANPTTGVGSAAGHLHYR